MRRPDRPEELDNRTASGEKGAAQRVLLLVLLLVVVLFGYLYFFTGVVKPREDVAPPPAATVVRKPIPSRPGAEQASGAVAKASEKDRRATTEAETKAPSVEKDTAAQAESKRLAQKVPPASKPKVAEKDPAPAVKAASKALPEQKAVKQAPLPEKKQADAPKSEKVPSKPSTAKPVARYVLSAGEFILDENLKRTQRQLKKIGIHDLTVSTRMKSEPMHRVHMGDFSSRAEADAELKKVQKAAKSAFILPDGQKYSLYAGSFFNAAQAAKEKDRLSALAASGQSVTVKPVNVTVPVKRLMAGAYPDKESAAAAAERVKKAGIAAAVVPLQKAAR